MGLRRGRARAFGDVVAARGRAARTRRPCRSPRWPYRGSMSPAGAASSGQVLGLARAARALGLRCRRAARDEIGRLGLGDCKRGRLRPHLTGRLRAGAKLQHGDPDLELVARAHPSRHAQLRVVHERAAWISEVLDERPVSGGGHARVLRFDMRVGERNLDRRVAADHERAAERHDPPRVGALDDLEAQLSHAGEVRTCAAGGPSWPARPARRGARRAPRRPARCPARDRRPRRPDEASGR